MATRLATLESLLRARKLDGTLVSSRPLPREQLAPTEIASLDTELGGGLVRGQLSEIIGPPSSGRTSLLCSVLAAATRRGEVVTLIDAFDSFDPRSAAGTGLDLSRLLWVRGRQRSGRQTHRTSPTDEVDRAIKAAGLVCQAGRFGIVAIDLAEAPLPAIHRLPFTTWRRLGQSIEGTDTVAIVVGRRPMGRSARGRSITLATAPGACRWSGTGPPNRMFEGIRTDVRVASTREPERACHLTTQTVS